jgi:hypothetical protein
MQNARSDRVCLDFSLLRFFVSRQRNEEEQLKILLLFNFCKERSPATIQNK